MERFFEVDFFLKKYKSLLETNELTTTHIASWLDCTVRHVQKWAINNGVDFISKGGRKYYIWNETKIREFATYYNRNHNKPKKPSKPKKRYYIPRWDKAVETYSITILKMDKETYRKSIVSAYGNSKRTLRRGFDTIAKYHGDWLTDEYLAQEIINGNQKLLTYLPYFMHYYHIKSWSEYTKKKDRHIDEYIRLLIKEMFNSDVPQLPKYKFQAAIDAVIPGLVAEFPEINKNILEFAVKIVIDKILINMPDATLSEIIKAFSKKKDILIIRIREYTARYYLQVLF